MKKVLIVSGGLQVGGAEKIAASISLNAPKDEFDFHYLVFEGIPNDYGSLITENGYKVITIPSPQKSYISFIKNIRELIGKYHYDVVHCHTMFNSGIILRIAKKMKVPCRIAHSHTTKTEYRISFAKNIYQHLMRRVICVNANYYFACGREAGYWLFGKRAFEKKGIIIPNGINVDDFVYNLDHRKNIREYYQVSNCFVIGHTGSLIKVKNQSFLLELLKQIVSIKENSVLMLVGGGADKQDLENKAVSLGIQNHVIFVGQVNNVNQFLSAFDIFVFPSLREGTPLSLIESQANGLPCVVSENIPDDVFLTPLIHQVKLDDPEKWIQEIISLKRKDKEYSEEIKNKGYDVKTSFERIYEVYRG